MIRYCCDELALESGRDGWIYYDDYEEWKGWKISHPVAHEPCSLGVADIKYCPFCGSELSK